MSEIQPPNDTKLIRGFKEEIFTSICREKDSTPDSMGVAGYDEVEVRLKSTIYANEPNVEIKHISVLWDAFTDNPDETTRTINRNEATFTMSIQNVEMLIAALQDAVAQLDESEEQWAETYNKIWAKERSL